MTTQDNAFRATGTGIPLPPDADFLASTGTRSVRHGFLTTGRFSTGGSFSGRITGVEGKSVNRVGVFGQTEEPEIPFTTPVSAGVFGVAKTTAGVYGYSANGVGVVGITSNPASLAGGFIGTVTVNGTFNAVVKNGVVPFPDGSQRVLHCMESPEHWFEDFGSAKLARGSAVVKLDANFAKVIKRGDYRVFITPEGNCHGLYVRRKSANSFEVHELTGGKSSVAFSYRIVGRRKDIKQHRRFAKFDTRLPLPPREAGLRRLIARVEKDARAGR